MSTRADKVGDPGVPDPSRDLWFNPSAYAVPALYKFGNAERNSLRGPGVAVVNLSLFKNFRFNERGTELQFRWEVYNAFNRTNLDVPNHDVDPGNATAGKITAINAFEPMRNMQFGLRLNF
jgi:hypothetical protein